MRVAVASPAPGLDQQAKTLADSLQLPLVNIQQLLGDQGLQGYDYFLVYENSILRLRSTDTRHPGVLAVDFSDPKLNYRVKSSIKNQNIMKAVGVKAAVRPKVLDATAGLGKDAFLLASLGCEVLLLERSIIVHALLEDGLRRAAQGSDGAAAVVSKMSLLHYEFIEFTAETRQFDVVYLDPMFPARRKSAKVKKDMALLQQFLGHEADNEHLLEQAQNLAQKRVVVKRAKLSPYLSSMTADIQYKGNSSRYDVYLSR